MRCAAESIGLGRRTALASALGLIAALPAAAAPRAGAPECRAASTRGDALQALGPRGEVVLASGTRALLGSLRWPEDPVAAAEAEGWLRARAGRALAVTARGEADRWGRIRIDAADEADGTDLAGGLIEAGLAHADAGEGDVLCRPALLAVEAGARAGGRGLWAREPVRDARDGAALRARAGRFLVAEGRLLNVGERAARTYLDFVRRGEDGLTVTVSKRTWRRLQERGLSAAGLRGRTVRVRGIVEIGRGPVLDLTSADALELLGEAARPLGEADRERALRR
ncbi:hypothetical protein [Methylobacterium sp. A54F]